MAQSDADLIVGNECGKTLTLLVKWNTSSLLLKAISDYYSVFQKQVGNHHG